MSGVNTLETLAIRMVGNADHWNKTIRNAEKGIHPAVKSIEQATLIAANSMDMGLKRPAMSLQNFSSQLKAVGGRIQSIGRQLTTKITLPLTAIGGLSVREFAKFDDAMTKSLSIMTGVSDEMKREMEDVVKSISGRSITAPEKLAEAYYFLASAGLSAEQSMQSLAVVERFAVAGAFDMAQATDLLTDAQTALGMAFKDPNKNMTAMIKLSDNLVRAAQQANASVQQFSESLTNDAASASRSYGMELETTLAVLAAYASAGKKGAEAGNLMGRATRLLTKSFRENGAVFEQYGINVINEATGGYRNFIDVVKDMEVAFKDMTDPQRDAALEMLGFNALAQKSILPLLGLSGAMKEYEANQRKVAGTTDQVANKQLKSFTSQMKILWNNVKITAITIGNELVPAIQWMSKYLKMAIDWFKGISSSQRKFVILVGVMVAAVGPLTVILGTTIAFLGAVVSGISALAAAVSYVSLPVVAAVAAIGALVGILAGIVVYIIGPKSIISGFQKMGLAVKDFTIKAIGFMMNFKQNVASVWKWFQNNSTTIFKDVGALFGTMFGNMVTNISVSVGMALKIFNYFHGYMYGLFVNLFSVDMTRIFAGALVVMLSLVAKFANGFAKAILNAMIGKKTDVEKIQNQMIKGVQDGLNLQNPFAGIKAIVDEGRKGFVGALDGFEPELKNGPKLALEWGKKAGKEFNKGQNDEIKQNGGALKQAIDVQMQEAIEPQSSMAAEMIKQLEEQVNTFGMGAEMVDIYRAALDGATDSQLQQIYALNDMKKELEDQKNMMDKAARLTEKFMDPQKKLAKEQKEITNLFQKGLIELDVYNNALKDLQDKANKGVTIDFKTEGVQGVEAGSAAALARLNEFRSLKKNESLIGKGMNSKGLAVAGANAGAVAVKETIEKTKQVKAMGGEKEGAFVDLLSQIAGNTGKMVERPQIVFEEANLDGGNS